MDYGSKSPTKKRSTSPKSSSPKELVAYLLLPEHRNVFEMIQREYIAPEDRLNLREVAKIVNVVGDRQNDIQRGAKPRMINSLKKLLNEYDEMTREWEENENKLMKAKPGMESMNILEENMKIIKKQRAVEDSIRETVDRLNSYLRINTGQVLSQEERQILRKAEKHV